MENINEEIKEFKAEIFDMIRRIEIINKQRAKKVQELEELERRAKE